MDAVRSLTIALAWIAATAAAVAVSWLGVRTVVHDAVLDPPQLAVPINAVATGTPPPTPSTVPTPTSAVRPTTVPPNSPTVTVPTTTTTTTVTPADQNVHRYQVKGGEVVLSLNDTSAKLVSATPAGGYSVQAWQETGWLRVDFTSGANTSSVFATWNGHAPSVQAFDS
jgi:acyl-CoA hydrolase